MVGEDVAEVAAAVAEEEAVLTPRTKDHRATLG